jgi:hypothetical protein
MTFSITKKTWVYAVISNSGENGKLTGFQDKNEAIFIPILKTKIDAEGFLGYMPRNPGIRYEVQAIIFEDVLKFARESGSLVYLVNAKGEILEKGYIETVQ